MAIHTVLIADDDHDLVRLLSHHCRALGLNVRAVNNSLDLLNAIYRQPPSLLCVDVEMPCGNGLSACEMLAAQPELAVIPTIVMTGKSDPETIRRCWQLNAYYVLKCPEIWPRLEPLMSDLLHLPPAKSSPRGDSETGFSKNSKLMPTTKETP
jgi:CheY-like chemotaxis protein